MGKLEVIFKIRLAYPGLFLGGIEPVAIVHFADTGNTVRLEAPRYGPPTGQPALEGYEQMVLHVERECTDKQGRDTSTTNSDQLRITQDVGRAFWHLFEAIREAAVREENKIFMYSVVPAEDIRLNPLVRACESEWIYDGKCLEQLKMAKGIPAIEVTSDRWTAAVLRLTMTVA